MTVYLKKPIKGYAKGILTGNTHGNQREIILGNGKSILLYTHEFSLHSSPFPDSKMTFCACGNSVE